MTTYTDRYALTQDPELLARIRVSAVKAALDVLAEAPGDDATSTARRALAAQVLDSPAAWAQRLAYGVVNNGNVGLGGNDDPVVGDGTLDFVVASVWTAYASVAATKEA